jgi:hypothetical protein
MQLFYLLFIMLLTANSCFGELLITWEEYACENATNLRVYSSLDKESWIVEAENIPTNDVQVVIPNGPAGIRSYYLVASVNNNLPSDDPEREVWSDVVSFMMSNDGTYGASGPGQVDNMKIVNCADIPDEDDGTNEWKLCQNQIRDLHLYAEPIEDIDYYMVSLNGREIKLDSMYDMLFFYDLLSVEEGMNDIVITPYKNDEIGVPAYCDIQRATKGQWIYYNLIIDGETVQSVQIGNPNYVDFQSGSGKGCFISSLIGG